jgi:hypothetical protein
MSIMKGRTASKPKHECDIYHKLGLFTEEDTGNTKVVCPACEKDKLYIDGTKSVFKCQVCGIGGNNATFLPHMLPVFRADITTKLKERLALRRGLPATAFDKEDAIGYCVTMDEYVFPILDSTEKMVSARHYRFAEKGKKSAVMAFPRSSNYLMGAEQLIDGDDAIVYVAEGEWDFLAMRHVLRTTESKGIVVAIPGASNVNEQICKPLFGRNIIYLQDNDAAGVNGAWSFHQQFSAACSSVQYIHWPESYKDGHDINDLVESSINEEHEVLEYIRTNTVNIPPTSVRGNPVEIEKKKVVAVEKEEPPVGLDVLHATFSKWLKNNNTDLLDVMLGVMWAIRLPGDPLWLMIVAPPAGSKSETMMPVSKYSKVHAVSHLTRTALVSGFNAGKDSEDPGILGKMDGAGGSILMIKDLTPLLTSNEVERDEVFGMLRDAFDGQLRVAYGNGVVREYNELHFAVIAGVTPMIDMMSGVAMGERFVKFRSDWQMGRSNDIEKTMQAITNTGHEDVMREELRVAAIGSLNRQYDVATCPRPDETFASFVAHLALFVANARAAFSTDKDNNTLVEPIVEVPTRLSKQFLKMAMGLAMHFQAKSLNDPRVLGLVRRVAAHSPDLITMRIIKEIHDAGSEGLSSSGITCTPASSTTKLNILGRLKATGIIATDKPGRLLLSPTMIEAATISGIFNLPPHDILMQKVHYANR